jgi:transposase
MVHDLRAMCDAVAYVGSNGIEWRALPVDLPPGHQALECLHHAADHVGRRRTRTRLTRCDRAAAAAAIPAVIEVTFAAGFTTADATRSSPDDPT